MKDTYYPPTFKGTQFTCPHCGVLANQVWKDVVAVSSTRQFDYIYVSTCLNNNCKKECLWMNRVMTIPDMEGLSYPNEDLNQDIKDDYLEARSIVNKSPRGASALLRLALQKLCKQLGEKGENINTDISNLVKKGLRPSIQKALDIIRVTGNESVHPGILDMKDNNEVALEMFKLINLIAEVMITEPKRVDILYSSIIPEDKQKAIEVRDGVKNN